MDVMHIEMDLFTPEILRRGSQWNRVHTACIPSVKEDTGKKEHSSDERNVRESICSNMYIIPFPPKNIQ